MRNSIAARGAEALDEVRLALEATDAEVLAVPTDVGDDAAVWLVSPRARWGNGAALVVDGGQSKAIL